MRRRRRWAVVALAGGLGLGGCGGAPEGGVVPDPPLRLERVELHMLEGINEGWPARIALVRVPDAALVEGLLRMTPEDWFGAPGVAFLQAHPQAMHEHWEVVPGTRVGPIDVRRTGDLAGVLFCGLRESVAPSRVQRDGDVVVSVDASGCTVLGGVASSSRWRLPLW